MSRACFTLSVYVAPGTEPWALTPEEADALGCMMSRDTEIHFWPRARLDEIWRRTHDGTPAPAPPYAFRAWSNPDGRAHILADATETPQSIRWLVLHELAHLDLVSAPLLARAYRGIPKPENYLVDDEAHEARPEEQMANFVADQLAPLLGSAPGYDRRWWRGRVERQRTLARREVGA